MKINSPRPSLPTQLRSSTSSGLPQRPPPRAQDDGFESTKSGPVSLRAEIPERTAGQQAVDLARSVLGQHAHDLKLANNTTLGAAMQDWVGDKVNCANFVSGLLIATGQISAKDYSANVTGLMNNLKKDGKFSEVPLANAQPGDVVIMKHNGQNAHVVIFAGRDENGQPKFIGSNNDPKLGGNQKISEFTGLSNYWSGVTVLHNNQSGAASVPAPSGADAPSSTSAASNVEGITESQATWLRGGSSGPAVEDLQKKLAAAGFDPGPIDGSFGPKTQAAVRAFQAARGCQVDGIVGPETRAALLGQPYTKPETPSTPSTPSTPVGPGGDSATAKELEAMALKKHGPAFLAEVKAMAGRLGVKPEWILAVMKNESGMDPKARNPNGGATGLIQFMPSTARGLGTTTEALSKMSALEQLKYVEKYYAPFKGKISSGTDLYMATFWPAGVGKPDSYKIGGAEVARVNKIFDLDKNGQITAGEFREYYRRRFPELA